MPSVLCCKTTGSGNRPCAQRVCLHFQLGGMYYDGEVVPRDFLEVSKWYREAAEQNDALGQAKLGILHCEGVGVPQDFVLDHMG